MTARRFLRAWFLLVACTPAQAQELPPTGTLPIPSGRIAQSFATEPNYDPPILLPMPEGKQPSRKPCRSCANEYNPNHVYLPEQSPDCKTGGCDGDCKPCRQFWFEADFFVGKSSNLPSVDRRFLYGVFAEAGYWFSEERTAGLDLSFLTTRADFNDSQFARTIQSPFTLSTGDVNLRAELYSQERLRIDGLIGYRYLRFDETYLFSTPTFLDDQHAVNTLNAGQIGINAQYRFGPYFAEALGKLAFGSVTETLDRSSVRTVESGWCLVPTFGARVGYQLGESIWGTLGYQLLYVSNFDRPTQPDADYLLHGLTIGFLKRF